MLYGYRQFHYHVKAEDINEDIAKDVGKRFDISNYELERLLPKEKNKRKFGLMKDALSRKIIKEFVRLRTKTYSYLTDDNCENKKTKGIKNML